MRSKVVILSLAVFLTLLLSGRAQGGAHPEADLDCALPSGQPQLAADRLLHCIRQLKISDKSSLISRIAQGAAQEGVLPQKVAPLPCPRPRPSSFCFPSFFSISFKIFSFFRLGQISVDSSSIAPPRFCMVPPSSPSFPSPPPSPFLLFPFYNRPSPVSLVASRHSRARNSPTLSSSSMYSPSLFPASPPRPHPTALLYF